MTRRSLLAAALTSILDLKPPPYDARISYGPHPLQFGDLRLPKSPGPHPVLIFIHGGFWKAAYNLDHAGHLCAAVAQSGVATWNLEYRRIGNPGGGWPGTGEDVESGAQFIGSLAKTHPLDLNRVIVAGHSAGGQLALWLASRNALPLQSVVSLAGVADLRLASQLRLSNSIVDTFLHGSPSEAPQNYAAADPMERLPISTPQRLLHGTADDIVPFEISQRFARASKNATLIPLPNAGHFELIDPRTPEWKTVSKSLLAMK